MISDPDFTPTGAQQAQALLVQNEVVELVNRCIVEGIDFRVVLAGLGSATAATVMSTIGPRAVPLWFARMSSMTAELARPN